MLTLIGITLTIVATVFAYRFARRFVRNRMRFVDAVHTRKAPLLAGAVTGAAMLPVVALLPLVGVGTALLVGVGVAAGVAGGSRDAREPMY